MPRPRRHRDSTVEKEFQDFAARYRARHAELEDERSKLLRERDAFMRRAHAAGLSLDEIAQALGLTRPYVSRTVRPR